MTTDAAERWIDKQLEDNYTFKNESELRDILLDMDPNDKMQGFMFGSRFGAGEYKKKYKKDKTWGGWLDESGDKSVDKSVDKNKTLVDSNKEEIEDSKSKGDLRKIDVSLTSVRGEYHPSTITQIENLIESRSVEIESLEGTRLEVESIREADTIISRINRAKTLDVIDAIDIDIPPSSARDKAVGRWNDRRFEIQEEIEEETGEFPVD